MYFLNGWEAVTYSKEVPTEESMRFLTAIDWDVLKWPTFLLVLSDIRIQNEIPCHMQAKLVKFCFNKKISEVL